MAQLFTIFVRMQLGFKLAGILYKLMHHRAAVALAHHPFAAALAHESEVERQTFPLSSSGGPGRGGRG